MRGAGQADGVFLIVVARGHTIENEIILVGYLLSLDSWVVSHAYRVTHTLSNIN